MKKRIGAVLCGIGFYLVFLLLPSGILLLTSFVVPEATWGMQTFLQTFSTLLIALILVGCYRLFGVRLRDSVGFAPRAVPFKIHLAAFIMGILGNSAVTFVMNFLPESWLNSYAQQSAGVYNPAQGVGSVLAIVICAPIGEELLFRGLIYRSFRKALPFWAAAVLSSLLFGVAHGHPVWITYAFLMGFCFSVMLKRTGSISVTIMAHIGFNLASLPSLILTEESLWYKVIYGSPFRYLLFSWSCVVGCIMLWHIFFRKRNNVPPNLTTLSEQPGNGMEKEQQP